MLPLEQAMRDAWAVIADRFQAYELVVPGTTAFDCLQGDCTEHCCNRYTVNLSERDVDRVARFSGRSPRDFLECEEGEPIFLPIAQPYVLTRAGGTCVFLQDDMGCGVYEGRPNACRLYPHFVLLVDPGTGRPTYGEVSAITASMAAWLSDSRHPLVPVLTRHRACPGFEGGRILAEGEWLAILRETARIQYSPESSDDWPMADGSAPVTVAAEARSLP
jgi:Fe-S-cluster containining protein